MGRAAGLCIIMFNVISVGCSGPRILPLRSICVQQDFEYDQRIGKTNPNWAIICSLVIL